MATIQDISVQPVFQKVSLVLDTPEELLAILAALDLCSTTQISKHIHACIHSDTLSYHFDEIEIVTLIEILREKAENRELFGIPK